MNLKDEISKAEDNVSNLLTLLKSIKSEHPEILSDDPVKEIDVSSKNHWGYHLLIDASECKRCDDKPYIVQFFTHLIKELKMKPLTEPLIVSVNNETGRGTSCVQVITTSTLTYHSDDDQFSIYMDIFTCKPFKPQVALNLFEKYFSPSRMGTKFVYRDAGSWPKK